MTTSGSVGWLTAVEGRQVGVRVAGTQFTVLQCRETRDVVAIFVSFPTEAATRSMFYNAEVGPPQSPVGKGVSLTGVPLTVVSFPIFQPLAPLSK